MKAFIIISLALLSSCGTRKTATEERRDVRREESARVRAGSVMGITISDSIGEKLRHERVYRITILSPPDSLGRQWPITIEEGTVTEDYAGGRLVTKDSMAVSDREVQRDVTTTDKSVSDRKTGTDTRIIPRSIWWFLIVGGVAVLIGWFIIENSKWYKH